MITDPVIGSFVWVTSSLAFLAASTALVRMLDSGDPLGAGGTAREAVQTDAPPGADAAAEDEFHQQVLLGSP